MFFTFRFLIILSVENIMCQGIVLRKPISFMCMRQYHRMTFLYLSRMPWGEIQYHDRLHMMDLVAYFFTLQMCQTGSIDVMSHPDIISKILGFLKDVLSTACRIQFTSWLMMFWNQLLLTSLCISRSVYCLFFSYTCCMGQCESFTVICALFLFLIRCIMY